MSLIPLNAAGTANSPIDGLGVIFEVATYTVSGTTITPGTYTQVANLIDFKPHEVSHGKIKTSTHSTTGLNGYRPAGLGEPGESEASLLYDKTAYGALSTWQLARTPLLARTTYRDSATDAIAGYIAGLKVVTPLEGDASMDLKFQHSGNATIVTT